MYLLMIYLDHVSCDPLLKSLHSDLHSLFYSVKATASDLLQLDQDQEFIGPTRPELVPNDKEPAPYPNKKKMLFYFILILLLFSRLI